MNRELRKDIYERGFNILMAQDQMANELESLGLRFDYDETPIGVFLGGLLNNGEAIIKNALGLHTMTEYGKCKIGGCEYDVPVYILYPEDDNADWSITDDGFVEFIYQAKQKTELQELLFKAIVDRDENAKEKFNEVCASSCQIGCFYFDK